MAFQVKIVTERKVMRDFLRVPYKIYKDDQNWVAPMESEIKRILNKNKNPYFHNADLQLFVCYKNEEPVSRAAVVINYEIWKLYDRKVAYFGFFEAVYNQKATSNLFKKIESYCREKGVERLEGPFNPNHYSELGLLIKNFESPPKFFETYNPSWYKQRLLNIGFSTVKTIYTQENKHFSNWVNEKCRQIKVNNRHPGFNVRHFNLFHFRKDMEAIREINNDAFSENAYFLPLSSREYSFSAKFLFLITSPRLITLVEHNKKPVGVLQAVLNVNHLLKKSKGKFGIMELLKLLLFRHRIKEVILYAVGIKKDYRNTFASHLVYNAVCDLSKKYPEAATTWMSDDNPGVLRITRKLGMQPYKWFSIFSKTLKQAS